MNENLAIVVYVIVMIKRVQFRLLNWTCFNVRLFLYSL
jgi:hypothetical protein